MQFLTIFVLCLVFTATSFTMETKKRDKEDLEVKIELDKTPKAAAQEDDIVMIKTDQIQVTGRQKTLSSGKTIKQYLGIPFVQPPVGVLRFKPPQPITGNNIFDGLEYGSDCPQLVGLDVAGGSEDCLFLNIFAPGDAGTDGLRPVMVFIHGGGFASGAGKVYEPTPLVEEGVIVVTFNYRLAGLGFMTFGNDVVSGNMGLRDQIEALRWTKKFIENFGGDPRRITVFGQSAGSMSVNALQISPKTEGLISGAIGQSGTILFFSHLSAHAREERIAVKLAKLYNCSSTDLDQEMLNCLQAVPFERLILDTQDTAIVEDVENDNYERGPWYPVQDAYSSDPVIPLDAVTAFKLGKFTRVPWMSGTVTSECLPTLPAANFEKQWNLTAPWMVGVAASMNNSEATPAEFRLANNILRYYNGMKFNLEETVDDVVDMLNDGFFITPDQMLSEFATEWNVPVYNYRFTEKGSQTFLPFLIGHRTDLSEEFKASLARMIPVHGDELIYMFNVYGMNEKNEMSRILLKYWTNFAAYGNPSPAASSSSSSKEDNLPKWDEYSKEKRYMELTQQPVMKENLYLARMEFWRKMFWVDRMNKSIAKSNNVGMNSNPMLVMVFILFTLRASLL